MRTLSVFCLCWIAPFTNLACKSTPCKLDRKPVQAAPAETSAKPARSAPSSSLPAIDPAKEAAIRNMFEVLGMSKMMQQVLTGMSSSIKPMLMSTLAPGDYREKLADLFFQRFQCKVHVEQLADIAVPIYDKYFSKEEVAGLTRFYQTPLGQKALSVPPQSLIEMRTASMKLGENLGREAMAEVLEEHLELKKDWKMRRLRPSLEHSLPIW